MIPKNKKRITVTLDPETINMAEDWEWKRVSWSDDVNLALQLLYNTFNKNNPIARILNKEGNKND